MSAVEHSKSDGQAKPLSHWTKPEPWVWDRIRNGESADFNELHGELDPESIKGWSDDRVLSSDFIETILLAEPFRSEIPRQGVQIFGAWFKESLDLEGANINCRLRLNKSRFESEVLLNDLQSESSIYIADSVVTSDLILDSSRVSNHLVLIRSEVGGVLNMRSINVGKVLSLVGTNLTEVFLAGAHIEETLNFDAGTVTRGLGMDSIRVDKNLFMRDGAYLEGINLRGGVIGSQLEFDGSKVGDKLGMDSVRVGGNLFFRDEAIFDYVTLRGARVVGQIDVANSIFQDRLFLDSLQVGENLLLRDGSQFQDIVLRTAKIGGQMSLSGSSCNSKLTLDGVEIANNLFFVDGTQIQDVILRTTTVGGQLSFSDGCKCSGSIYIDATEIGSSLFFKRSVFNSIGVINGKVGGQVEFIDSEFSGALNVDGLDVTGNLYMGLGSDFQQSALIQFVNVGGNVDLSGGAFTDLNLSGSRVKGELRLGSSTLPRPTWQASSKLNLSNLVTYSVQDSSDGKAWPGYLALDGFKYSHLGASDGGALVKKGVASRNLNWFIDWLSKDPNYRPQSYKTLAEVMQNMGSAKMANDILFAGKERERHQAEGLSWMGLSLSSWVIGYGFGHRYFYVLRWVIAITFIGAFIYGSLPQSTNQLEVWLSFSLDILLPIVSLDSAHQINFDGFQRYYFYFHKLIGYVLGFFVVAGLSGITKK